MGEIQELLLADRYIKLVKDGIKNSTVRLGVRPIQLGWLELKPTSGKGENIIVNVKCIESKTVHDLSKDNANADGFKSVPELVLALTKFYPDIKATDDITVIYW